MASLDCARIHWHVQGGRLALGHFRLSKLGMVPVLAPFSAGMGPFGRLGRSKLQRKNRRGTLTSIPFLGGVKKIKV